MPKSCGQPKSFVIVFSICLLAVGISVNACSASPTAVVPAHTDTVAAESPLPAPTAESSPRPTTDIPSVADSPLAQSPLPTPLSGSSSSELEVPRDAPVPQAGRAAVSGVLYSIAGKGPVPETLFYITPARGDSGQALPVVLDGPHDEDGDIKGTSDKKGWIALSDVPPGSYFLVVWAPYSWNVATESEAGLTPRLITLEADQRLNLELIFVSWP
jgi:hypothetical protein